MVWGGVLYFVQTYWVYIVLALLIGLLAGWFSFSPDEDNEGEAS